MDLQKSICLIYVWWLLSLGTLLLITVSAQEMVLLTIVTPEADPKEGVLVEMRCEAGNLQLGVAYNVSWVAVNPPQTVTLGTMSNRTIDRLEFRRTQTSTSGITEYLTINDVQRADSGQYKCSIRKSTGGSQSATRKLSVLYFPDEPSPLCSPNGPITVQSGTSLSLQCSSEEGNPAVQMMTSPNPPNNKYTCTWQESRMNDTVTRSLTFTVETEDHNVSFVCTISSSAFPGMRKDCRIGPISVTPPSDSTTIPTMEPAQGTIQTDLVPTSYTQAGPTSSASSVALIAGASVGGLAAVVLIVLTLIIVCRRRAICTIKRQPETINTIDDNTELTSDNLADSGQNQATRSRRSTGRRSTGQDQPTHPQGTEAASPTPVALTRHPRGQELDTDQQDALPGEAKALSVGRDTKTKTRHTYQSLDDAKKQGRPNPAFDPGDIDGPSEAHVVTAGASVKPMAKVAPVQKPPEKPAPYKPKTQSVTATPSGPDNRSSLTTPRSPMDPISPATPLEGNQDGGVGDTTLPRPEEQPHEAQDPQVPSREQEPRPNHLLYADLDLRLNPRQDGNQQRIVLSDEPTAYARISIQKK